MRKLLMGLVVAAAVSLSMPLAASAAEYETFVGCDDLAANPTPSHVCQVGDFPGAFLESDTDTIFEFCLEFPTEEILCTEEEFAEAGTLSAISLPADIPGNYFAVWFVGEEVIGAWEFRMESPPPPPPAPPAASPPAPAPPPVLTSPSSQCLKARHRVSTLKNQLRNADGRKRKAKLRSKLKTAKAKARRLC